VTATETFTGSLGIESRGSGFLCCSRCWEGRDPDAGSTHQVPVLPAGVRAGTTCVTPVWRARPPGSGVSRTFNRGGPHRPGGRRHRGEAAAGRGAELPGMALDAATTHLVGFESIAVHAGNRATWWDNWMLRP